jgi:hypothetical protein
MKKSILIFIFGLVLLFGLYRMFNPAESFYSREFEIATTIPLPSSATFIEGHSDWGLTCAIHEISHQDWDALVSTLQNRASRNQAKPSSFYPELLNALGGDSDIFVLKTQRRYVFVGLNNTRRRIFWEVWHN